MTLSVPQSPLLADTVPSWVREAPSQKRGLTYPLRNSSQHITDQLQRLSLRLREAVLPSRSLSQLIDKSIGPDIEIRQHLAIAKTFHADVTIATMCRHPNDPLRLVIQGCPEWRPSPGQLAVRSTSPCLTTLSTLLDRQAIDTERGLRLC
jgi:hypothetical protein